MGAAVKYFTVLASSSGLEPLVDTEGCLILFDTERQAIDAGHEFGRNVDDAMRFIGSPKQTALVFPVRDGWDR